MQVSAKIHEFSKTSDSAIFHGITENRHPSDHPNSSLSVCVIDKKAT